MRPNLLSTMRMCIADTRQSAWAKTKPRAAPVSVQNCDGRTVSKSRKKHVADHKLI